MKLPWILAVSMAVALMAGCSGGASKTGSGETPGTTSATPDNEFKVALITPGKVSDSGWNALAYEGLQGIEAELAARVNNQEALGSKIKDAMRSYAQQDYDLVIGHGFEYNEPAMEVGKDFPNTVFLSTSGANTAKNVGAFRFNLEQGFYMAGYMAASMSKTGKVAMIGGDKVPSIASTFKGFEAGAKAANPNCEVMTIWVGSFDDVAKAKQATLTAIEQGADMVIHQANEAAQGVFEACKEKGVWAFGANANQNDNPSGRVIASAVIVAKPVFLRVAKSVKEGKYEGNVELVTMKDGAIDFIINQQHVDQLPEGLVTKLVKLRDDIIAGTVVVPKDEF